MDPTQAQFHGGRRKMIDAYVALTMLALRAGADEDAVTALHGEFFDGNVEVKDAWTTAEFCAWLRRHGWPGRPAR